ncbi:ATP-binding cassette subfamily C member 4-like [Tubulanus polymorphus]|uniref:ATP-binding cassette subfamily C member 4-like n=1 Tax=Tubulanus polymorphus TaxID=672921 RepID=UPI003DA4AFB2
MDQHKHHLKTNPLEKANWLSKLIFWWINPIFRIGFKRRLEQDDLYNITDVNSAVYNADLLERQWRQEMAKIKEGKSPSFIRAIIRAYGPSYMVFGIFVFIIEAVKIIQPLLIIGLIGYFSGNVTETQAYLYAMGISLCALFLATVQHSYFQGVMSLGMRVRVSCCALMYRKALRLSNTSLNKTTVGQIVNLMSNDVSRFDIAVIFCHYLWLGPIQAVTVLALLWYNLGPSCLAGFAVLILLVPLQSYMGKLFAMLRRKTAVQTDERVRIMSEIISGMRVIKMYCWEKLFGDLVKFVRKRELRRIYTAKSITAVTNGVIFCASKLIILVIIVTSVLTGNRMYDIGQLYSTMIWINILRGSVIKRTILAIRNIAELYTSLKRIQEFLMLGELDTLVLDRRNSLRPKAHDCGVVVNQLTVTWDTTLETPTLKNISVTVKPGELIAVIGPVGSGKSSLLMSILGELHTIKGDVNVQGKVGYASQQPWVFTGTLKQNVLFGQQEDDDRFKRVVKATALDKDIEVLPDGENTLVGEKGVSLSGGQRARVSLARALYFNADVYLLDDPLSAVDSAVSKHLFNNCICGLIRNKPRILVTHQLQFLTVADRILILKEGEIVSSGTYNDLAKSGVDFAALLKEMAGEEEEDNRYEEKALLDVLRSQTDLDAIGSMISIRSMAEDVQPDHVTAVKHEEQRAIGSIDWSIYKQYVAAGSGVVKFVVVIVMNIIAQAVYIAADWWLSYWSRQEALRAKLNSTTTPPINEYTNRTIATGNITVSPPVAPSIDGVTIFDTYTNIYIFTGLTFGVLIFGFIRALMMYEVCVSAAKNLHNKMYDCISKAPIIFFDTNPVGRVQARFSSDQGRIDELLPTIWYDVFELSLVVLGSVFVAGFVNPWVFIPTVPLTCAFIFIRYYYLCTSREVKRIEAAARGPVFSHVSASLNGLYTVRAFGAQDAFVKEFEFHQDVHTEAWHSLVSTNGWFGVRLDWVSSGFVMSVAFCSVLMAKNLDGGLVGLSVTYAIALLGLFQWAVRQSAEVESQMISVERIIQYCNLEAEAGLTEPADGEPPPDDWPRHGAIQAERVCFSYTADGPRVLKNINFIIHPREKIGIVGRTGAGKSSLIAMLFRLAEPSGAIIIDGVDITKIQLHKLRKQISIIPQDPVLFSGTVRRNLDPFKSHSDEALWKSLEEVQLKSAIDDLSGGLESEICQGGSNFSVGQRQLICLARAILRRNKILVIDEATANVDPRTDTLIQATIREKFNDCTVLTIAHRLHTIMDSDRVMVLNEGMIVEFESPFELLQDNTSLFHMMVQSTGDTEAENLIQIAEDSHLKLATAESSNHKPTNHVNNVLTLRVPHSPPLSTNHRSHYNNSISPDNQQLDTRTISTDPERQVTYGSSNRIADEDDISTNQEELDEAKLVFNASNMSLLSLATNPEQTATSVTSSSSGNSEKSSDLDSVVVRDNHVDGDGRSADESVERPLVSDNAKLRNVADDDSADCRTDEPLLANQSEDVDIGPIVTDNNIIV